MRNWRNIGAALATLCAVGILAYGLLTSLISAPASVSDAVNGAAVSFTLSDQVGFWAQNRCLEVSWTSANIDRIYFNGRGTIGEHIETVCVQDGVYKLWWRVHYGDNVWRTYTLQAVTLTPLNVTAAVLLLALAGYLKFAPHPVSLQDARNLRQVLPYTLPLLLPLGYLVYVNWLTIDFGWHWDEITLVNQVRRSINMETIIPDFYNYPSLSFWLMLAALGRLPEYITAGNMLQIVEENEYWHFARVLFLLASSLGIAWTYLLLLVWRRNVWAALLGASAFALSWEVGYHLRWIAPDGLLMSFGALTMLLTITAYLYPARPMLLWGAVMAAGFAVGSKYPGGLVILPILIVAVTRWWGRPFTWMIGRLMLFGVAFVGAYLITTPGSAFAFPEFWNDVTHEIYHYGELGQGYYTVESGLPHLMQLLAYLTFVLYSHYLPIAAIFAGLVVVGAVALIRENPRAGGLFLLFPVLYVLYFSTQSVMYVRNMLVTVPYWSVLLAVGAVVVWRVLRVRPLRLAFAAVVVALLAVNFYWSVTSARSILLRGTYYDPPALVQTAIAQPDTVYWVAPELYDTLTETYSDALPPNITPDSADADLFAVTLSDNLLLFDSNYGAYLGRRFERPWLGVVQHFTLYEVNLNYYPGWDGDNRIVLIPIQYVAANKLTTP